VASPGGPRDLPVGGPRFGPQAWAISGGTPAGLYHCRAPWVSSGRGNRGVGRGFRRGVPPVVFPKVFLSFPLGVVPRVGPPREEPLGVTEGVSPGWSPGVSTGVSPSGNHDRGPPGGSHVGSLGFNRFLPKWSSAERASQG
jgi:hypothetical protein